MSGAGIGLGYAAAEQAADHAGDEWKALAYQAFVRHARRHGTFATEDVRRANPQVPPPPDMRAWGQIALAAKRDGLIHPAGYAPTQNKSRHGMIVNVWRAVR